MYFYMLPKFSTLKREVSQNLSPKEEKTNENRNPSKQKFQQVLKRRMGSQKPLSRTAYTLVLSAERLAILNVVFSKDQNQLAVRYHFWIDV